MGVEVKVLVLPPHPNAALGIEAGCPLGATADAYGALGNAERVGGFLKGRMRGTVAACVVEVGFNVQISWQLQRQTVMQRPAAVAHLAERLGESRRFKGTHKPLLALVHGLCVGGRGVLAAQRLLQFVAFRVVAEFRSRTARGDDGARHARRTPLPRLPGMPRLVHVVCIGKHGEPQLVGEAQQEASPQISPLGRSPLPTGEGRGGARRRLHVGNVALAIFVLQVYIHHVAARLNIVAQGLALVGLLLIYLQVFHGVIGQVLHQHLLVSAEERARAQQQLVDLAPIDEDFALVVQRHAGQLADEVVEHRTLGQLEGRGIVDEGVAAIVELHASGRHHDFVEIQVARLAHLQCSDVDVFGCLSSYRHPLPRVVIALELGTDEIVAPGPDLGSEVGLGDAVVAVEEIDDLQRVGNDDRVGCEHRHLRLGERPLQEAVFHIA